MYVHFLCGVLKNVSMLMNVLHLFCYARVKTINLQFFLRVFLSNYDG